MDVDEMNVEWYNKSSRPGAAAAATVEASAEPHLGSFNCVLCRCESGHGCVSSKPGCGAGWRNDGPQPGELAQEETACCPSPCAA